MLATIFLINFFCLLLFFLTLYISTENNRYMLNYIDVNKELFIGIHNSISIENVIIEFNSKIDLLSNITIQNDIIFKNQRYHYLKINNIDQWKETDLKSLCTSISKKFDVPSFYSTYRYHISHIECGITYIDPRKKHNRFILTGVWDAKSDIYFPKSNIISINPESPVFGPMNINLPTTITEFNQILNNYISSQNWSQDFSSEFKNEVVGRIVYATFVYHPSFVWNDSQVPSSLSLSIPKGDFLGSFNVFSSKYINKDEYNYYSVREEEITTKSISRNGDNQCDKFFETYNNLSLNGIMDFFRFLSDIYYKYDDESFKKNEIVDFLSVISKFINVGVVSIKTTKKGVVLTYNIA